MSLVLRRMPRKTKLIGMRYKPMPDDSILEVGATNDVVVVDERLRLIKRDARHRVRDVTGTDARGNGCVRQRARTAARRHAFFDANRDGL